MGINATIRVALRVLLNLYSFAGGQNSLFVFVRGQLQKCKDRTENRASLLGESVVQNESLCRKNFRSMCVIR